MSMLAKRLLVQIPPLQIETNKKKMWTFGLTGHFNNMRGKLTVGSSVVVGEVRAAVV